MKQCSGAIFPQTDSSSAPENNDDEVIGTPEKDSRVLLFKRISDQIKKLYKPKD